MQDFFLSPFPFFSPAMTNSTHFLHWFCISDFPMMISSLAQCLKITDKSHFILRAKRAMFTFWVDKCSLKMPKMVHFGDFLKTWSLLSNSVTSQFYKDKYWWKMPKLKSSDETILSNFKTMCDFSTKKWLEKKFGKNEIKEGKRPNNGY